MDKKQISAKINSSKPFGFATDIEIGMKNIGGIEQLVVEFVLEIPIGERTYKKLVFISGQQAERWKRNNLKNNLCVNLQGKHVPCPYTTERSQYLLESMILKVDTFDWEIIDYNGTPKYKSDYYKLRKLRRESPYREDAYTMGYSDYDSFKKNSIKRAKKRKKNK